MLKKNTERAEQKCADLYSLRKEKQKPVTLVKVAQNVIN